MNNEDYVKAAKIISVVTGKDYFTKANIKEQSRVGGTSYDEATHLIEEYPEIRELINILKQESMNERKKGKDLAETYRKDRSRITNMYNDLLVEVGRSEDAIEFHN